ncbi:hypothetical protein HN011_009837 [Eciton burchellii]|jgi:hypothetical protein|nr:hypothetical protein HN011_009837 [Eciton burchellii]
MSESSVSSSISEQSGRDQDDRAKATSRLRKLFCCFKRELCAAEIAEIGDSDDYDYIVEKLLVKRVPLGLFAIPADPQRTPSTSSHSTSLSTISDNNAVVNTVTRTTSTKNTIDRGMTSHDTHDFAASTTRFDEDGDQVPIVRRQVHLIAKTNRIFNLSSY